ncbi:eliciting plant response-like protein [Mycena haematopus]|nr:eliciting plant response-like protein [Mycena haematopus]
MKFFGLSSFAFFAVAALADTVAYDETYDDASTSLDVVACSDGPNGLETKGFTTFGSLPKFPFIGAAGAVAGWNSPQCGTCWQLTYAPTGVTINVLAVDHAGAGTFNVALEAMNVLTKNEAVELGRVTVTSKQVASSVCGL